MTVEIKICGITNIHDAAKAADLGADYLGFILCEASPRYIPPRRLKELCDQLPTEPARVGVFVNASPQLVMETIEACGLSYVQLHGDENLQDFADISVPLWKAVRVAPETESLPDDSHLAERLLLDTRVKGVYGGTGELVDLDVAARIAGTHKVMLAGGMDPENVSDAISRVRPFGVDVSTGVEATPGQKDHAKLKAFISAARSA